MIFADWDAPARVTAFTTTRAGGVSAEPYGGLNLAAHVGDAPDSVHRNRSELTQARGWSAQPLWLDQVHGTEIVRAEAVAPGTVPRADGAVTAVPGTTLAVLTADCLPVAACDREGTVVGVFHAGWRGLVAGVLENGLQAMGRGPEDLLVWIGPAIGAASYQVGPDVRDTYLASDPGHEAEFRADGASGGVPRWRFDLVGAAVRRLKRFGVGSIGGGRWDTFAEADHFFSHRRQAPCGRMATVIRLERSVP